MADSVFPTSLSEEVWRNEFFFEMVRDMGFSRDIGESENDIIQMVDDLESKAGVTVNIPLLHSLAGDGVEGDDTLEDNEEQAASFNYEVATTQKRNAIRVGKAEQKKSGIDLIKAYRKALKMWAMEDLDDLIVEKMLSANVDGTTAYASCTEAQKDAWLLAQNPTPATNARVLFGALTSNAVADHSTGLGNLDSTADDLSPALLALEKRLCQGCSPKMRPVKVDGGEWWKAYAGPYAFRDLETNMATTHQNAAPRSLEDNPLFKPGDLVSRGVMVHEVQKIGVITGVGAGGIDVTTVPFCGAQAIVIASKDRPKPIDQDRDYGNKRGIGIEVDRGVRKPFFGRTTDGSDLVQHGMGTLYVSGVAD